MSQKSQESQENCNHYFEIGQIAVEATAENYVYHKVGYAICRKCGEIKKQDV